MQTKVVTTSFKATPPQKLLPPVTTGILGVNRHFQCNSTRSLISIGAGKCKKSVWAMASAVARAYNGGLGAEPPAEVQGAEPPVGGQGGETP